MIGDFTNATGDPVFDGALREALAVDLAQSPSLNLVSVEKVAEALRSLGRPVGTRVTREIAPKLCPMLGAPDKAWEQILLRSEEHTSELQSHLNLVCRLLLEKKRKIQSASS